MVLAPEHPLVAKLLPQAKNADEVRAYVANAANKSDFERTEVAKEMTGVEIKGIRAVNPATKQDVPIWVADYVLLSYGTGAIMAVPGHDDRDWRFAKKFGLQIIEVISGGDVEQAAFTEIEQGTLVNSSPLNGLKPSDAIVKMTAIVESEGYGKASVQYKLRDWVFSRQHYWGEPVPMIDCPNCGWQPVPENELPLVLPEVERYQTTETGESPLALITDWVNTRCPKCGGPAKRETDTMPNWAGSSWYFLRYTDPHNDAAPASREALNYWTPVDWYNGGMEHTTLHLLYSRFWHKFLFDIGIVPTPEPYRKRTSHGLILGENGEKMSKSRGNVINPDEMAEKWGVDAFRLYEMFMGAFDQPIPWSTNGLIGMSRFLNRVWEQRDKISMEAPEDQATRQLVHQTIKQVGERVENMKFNTALSALMTLLNHFADQERISRNDWEIFVLLLAPFAPHTAEEMWHNLGHQNTLAYAAWPKFDEKLLREAEVELPVQVNGKVRARIMVSPEATEEDVKAKAMAEDMIQKNIAGKTIRKVIYVKGRLLNIIAS
jgi:leucyl-tRNA synthetase